MPLTELVHQLNARNQCAGGGSRRGRLDIVAGRIRAHFGDHLLGSLFQPIVAGDSGAVIGHEAHLKVVAGGGRGLPAQAIFLDTDDDDELIHLDRLARTLHALNFRLQPDQEGGFLALNVHPQLVQALPEQHGRAFEGMLAHCDLAPGRIVLEIADDGFQRPLPLANAIAAYRSRGFRVAIDNFGRHSTDLERLEALAPDIVKLDRSFSGHAGQLNLARRVMNELVPELRRLRLKVISQCIESEPQRQLAADVGVDALQGHLIGRPAEDCQPVVAAPQRSAAA